MTEENNIPEEEMGENPDLNSEEYYTTRHFGEGNTAVTEVHVDTGRGQTVPAPVGAPFVETIDRIAEAANYNGWYRVYLNGLELVEVDEAPQTIQTDQRIAITSYDKVG